MLTKDEAERLSIFQNAATLNQSQMAEYFVLLNKSQEPLIIEEPKEVKVTKIKRGRPKKK